MKKPIILCILDGCGIRESSDGNAFKNANKPTFDYLWNNYPHSILEASGTAVGLPKGQMGNSEVGHTNIGAGRIVYQPLEVINKAVDEDKISTNQELLNLISHIKNNNSTLHIMGLLSDGGVHSHINHLLKIIDILKNNNITKIYYHIFLDGRDVNPTSAIKYINILEQKIHETNMGKIATISGRYYAMDRDNNYDRLKKAYDAIVYGIGPTYSNPKDLLDDSYRNNITDEFIIPTVINKTTINDNDAVLTFNFRPDRLREIFTALTNPSECPMETKKLNDIYALSMMPITNTVIAHHMFDHQNLTNTLGEFAYKNNLSQLRIAETEKYAHVTYFFDGGYEKNYPNMNKILIPSPKVATYDLKPEMSAKEITDTLLKELDKNIYDIIILNYANGDMVGHTGNYEAAVKAVEYLDTCLKRLYDKVNSMDGIMLITADHGNCDIMWDENKVPITSHTTSPVPFIITKKGVELNNGILADIAPTIISLLNLEIPKEMDGKVLIK